MVFILWLWLNDWINFNFQVRYPTRNFMLFYFGKNQNVSRTHGFRVISENLGKSSKYSLFLGPPKFCTSQKPSQTHITLYGMPNDRFKLFPACAYYFIGQQKSNLLGLNSIFIFLKERWNFCGNISLRSRSTSSVHYCSPIYE